MFKFVILIGLGVGLSTFIGSLSAYFIKSVSHKTNDIILGFAAGVMLSATVYNLILPSLTEEYANIFITIIGVMSGTSIMFLIDKVLSRFSLDKTDNSSLTSFAENDELRRVILFTLAIAIHNFPEGLVVGVSFGNNNLKNAIAIAIGISLQNIPEGFVTIMPLLAIGLSKKRAFAIALLTGLSEVIGVVIGYMAVNVSVLILPFLLAFAGGTMLHVISHDMIPETHSHGYEKYATYALVVGFLFMMTIDYFMQVV